MRVDPRILIQQFSSFCRGRKPIYLLPFLVLVTGLVSTMAVTEQTRRFGEKEHQQIESTLLAAVIESLHSKLEINITMLGSVVGLFNASKEVSRLEFTTFYETVALNSGQLTGMQGVGFARWIPASALPAFEQRDRIPGALRLAQPKGLWLRHVFRTGAPACHGPSMENGQRQPE